MALLLRGPFLGMKHAAPAMKRQGFGSIINTASIAGVRVVDADHTYTAAKAALIHLTRSVAAELGETGYGSTASLRDLLLQTSSRRQPESPRRPSFRVFLP
jgi:NAD(P)-dependent dehydrogenase (short-subunit alcohol dehydrogenase family)